MDIENYFKLGTGDLKTAQSGRAGDIDKMPEGALDELMDTHANRPAGCADATGVAEPFRYAGWRRLRTEAMPNLIT